jgi:hypothetical protein
MARTEIVHDDPCLRMGVFRNLLVTAWIDAPDRSHARAMGHAIHTLVARYTGGFAVLNTIVSGTPRISDEFRAEILTIMRDPRVQGRGGAHLITLDGLGGVAARAFLSTVLLLGRSPSPNKVFEEPTHAAAWLAPLATTAREAWTPDQILVAFAEVARAPR